MIRRPRLSDVRKRLDRILHAQRHRRALRRAAAWGFPRSVLFVCYGNICRSPYAAMAFDVAQRRLAVTPARVDSAGFVGPGRPTPAAGVAAATRRGIDLRPHVSKVVTPEQVAASDLIVVVEGSQERALRKRFGGGARIVVLGDLDPHPIEDRSILDPWNQDEEAFDRSYERIDRCMAVLVREVATPPGGPPARTLAGADAA